MATERMSGPASSGSETNSVPSILPSPRSITINPSATAGKNAEAPAPGWRPAFRRLAASLTLKLIALIGIFLALPIILYGQFESADRQMRDLVTRAVQDRSALIADALAPTLRTLDLTRQGTLNADLAKYSSDGTTLKLMYQPAGERDAGRFYFVASAPQIRADEVSAELDELRRRGILQRLSDACTGGATNEIRYKQADGTVELLTSIIPIRGANGCWVLTSTHTTSDFLNTSIGRPYWQTPEIRAAALIYLVLAAIALLVAVSIRLSLRRFRDVAAEISQGRIGDYAFTHRNFVPELSSVARDFDKLVHDLRGVSQQIRKSAEDKAHSFKTPLATIRSALEPVRRAVPEDNQRARRALEIVEFLAHPPARPRDRRPAPGPQHRRAHRRSPHSRRFRAPRRRGGPSFPGNSRQQEHPPRSPTGGAHDSARRPRHARACRAERTGERHQLLASWRHDRRGADDQRGDGGPPDRR